MMTGFLIPLRRILLLSGLLLSLGARPHGVSPVAAGESDWPQFLGPMRNGVYGGPAISGSWPASGPSILWRKPVGEGFSGIVVRAGRLILFHRLQDRERVECLQAETGRPLWKYDYPTNYRDDFGFDGGPRATPSIWEGKVYTYGAQGVLNCLELESGRKIWSVKTHEKFGVRKGFFGAACSPLVEDGRLFLNVGGREQAGLVAFDARSGRVLWTATDDEASYSSPAVATLGGRRQVLFLTRTGLVSADPKSGEVLLRFRWRAGAVLRSMPPPRWWRIPSFSSPPAMGPERFASESRAPSLKRSGLRTSPFPTTIRPA